MEDSTAVEMPLSSFLWKKFLSSLGAKRVKISLDLCLLFAADSF